MPQAEAPTIGDVDSLIESIIQMYGPATKKKLVFLAWKTHDIPRDRADKAIKRRIKERKAGQIKIPGLKVRRLVYAARPAEVNVSDLRSSIINGTLIATARVQALKREDYDKGNVEDKAAIVAGCLLDCFKVLNAIGLHAGLTDPTNNEFETQARQINQDIRILFETLKGDRDHELVSPIVLSFLGYIGQPVGQSQLAALTWNRPALTWPAVVSQFVNEDKTKKTARAGALLHAGHGPKA